MRKNEKETARRMQTIAICGCLCLLAVGAGVTYRAFDRTPVESADFTEVEQPVTAVLFSSGTSRAMTPGNLPMGK